MVLGAFGAALAIGRDSLKTWQRVSGLGMQAIERPQESRQGFAGTRRSHYQGMGARGDRVPRAILRGRGLGKSAEEPFPGCLAETADGAIRRLRLLHSSIMPHGSDRISRSRGETVRLPGKR